MEAHDAGTHKRKLNRSPSYPAINLSTAIERAQTIYDREGQTSVPVTVIIEHWGYAPKSSGGFQTLAALKKFGLLDDEGTGASRKARLTGLALDILLDTREGSEQRQEALRKAALEPPIHSELWNEYNGNLPSDGSLRYALTRERNFTPPAADELIRELRSTIDFAGLTASPPSATVSGVEADKPHHIDLPSRGQEDRHLTPPVAEAPIAHRSPPAIASDRTYRFPLGSEEITLQGPFPLSEDAFEQMLRVLEVLKPGLTKSSGSS